MIKLQKNGLKEKVATGYSWKCLFFGCLYPLCIGDFKGAFRHFLYASITFGLSWLFVPFFYNSKKIKGMISDGWKPSNEKSENYLAKKFNYESESL